MYYGISKSAITEKNITIIFRVQCTCMCTITSPNMENGILVVTKIQIFFFPLSTPNEQHTGVLNGHDQ